MLDPRLRVWNYIHNIGIKRSAPYQYREVWGISQNITKVNILPVVVFCPLCRNIL